MQEIIKILIIKTAALGDVLRTAVILEGLMTKYVNPKIYWIADKNAKPLLDNNPYIEKIFYKEELLNNKKDHEVFSNKYDFVISLEEDVVLLGILKTIHKNEIFGVYLDSEEKLKYTANSSEWYDMSLIGNHGKKCADDLKKSNNYSYPELLYRMLDMRWNNQRYKLFITDANMSYANILKKSINTNTVIGLVISAGNRWPMKTLAIDQQIKLLKDLYKKYGKSITLILLYGHSELEKSYVEEIRRECPYVMTHEVQELRKFIGIVNICDIIITPDTLSMHISIALNKYVVAYFTVTSAAEIELYTGKKIIANHHDYCTYIKELKPRPNITDSINIQDIVLATEKLINNNR